VIGSIFHFNDYNRGRFVAEIAKSVRPSQRVFDAGAGPCKYKPLFSHCEFKTQDFCSYTGSEHKYGEIDSISDITSTLVPDASFDMILSTEVLEHAPRPDLAIGAFARSITLFSKLCPSPRDTERIVCGGANLSPW